MRVLVVEEDPMLAEFLRDRLIEEGFEVLLAGSGPDAERLLETETFEVMVLDLSLPDESGLHALRQARAKKADLAILVLAPAGSPTDCVKGLDAGADDYLAKPFSYAELNARIRALLRRRSSPAEAQLKVEDLVLDRIARTVQRGAASHRPDADGIRAFGISDGAVVPAGSPRADYEEKPGNWKRTSRPTWWRSTSIIFARRWMRDSIVR